MHLGTFKCFFLSVEFFLALNVSVVFSAKWIAGPRHEIILSRARVASDLGDLLKVIEHEGQNKGYFKGF